MTTPDFHAAGDAPRIAGSRTVEFTERAGGRVRHVHTVILCEGVPAPGEAALVQAARRAARQLGREVEGLEVRVVSRPEERPQAGA
jgi:hypothetical protein